MHYCWVTTTVLLLLFPYYCVSITVSLLLCWYYCFPTIVLLLLCQDYCLSITMSILLCKYYGLCTTVSLVSTTRATVLYLQIPAQYYCLIWSYTDFPPSEQNQLCPSDNPPSDSPWVPSRYFSDCHLHLLMHLYLHLHLTLVVASSPALAPAPAPASALAPLNLHLHLSLVLTLAHTLHWKWVVSECGKQTMAGRTMSRSPNRWDYILDIKRHLIFNEPASRPLQFLIQILLIADNFGINNI